MSDYYKKWYEEHRTEVLTRRKERYTADPSYRARELTRNRARRLKRQQEAAQAVLQSPKGRGWRRVDVDGVACFTSGALARVLGRTMQVVRAWEASGVIAEAPHRTPAGERLYTREFIERTYEELLVAGKIEAVHEEKLDPGRVLRKLRYADGREETVYLYKPGVLAKALGRSLYTVRQLETDGHLPVTPLFGGVKRRYRLYTLEQMKVVEAAYMRQGRTLRVTEASEAFRAEVREGWDKLRLVGAEVLEPTP